MLKVPQRIWQLLRRRFVSGYNGGFSSDSAIMERREKITVFVISTIFALVMWVVVNLGRDLSTTVQFELTVGELPEALALASDLPEVVTASVSGEGWRLLSLRNNPQVIAIDINQPEILLADMIREKVGPTGVDVLAVQPALLRTVLEERVSKKVPLEILQDIDFRGQYGLVGNMVANPDSVTIVGATSVLKGITSWQTDRIELSNVNSDLSLTVPLRKFPNILKADVAETVVTARVSEYTEGEQRVRVEVADLPPGTEVSFSPAYVTVRFSIPIQEYTALGTLPLFSATVPYAEIRSDSTGHVSPTISIISDSLYAAVRSVQPRRVSYFEVIK